MSASGSNFGARDLTYKKRKVASFIDDRIRSGLAEFEDLNTANVSDLLTRTTALEAKTTTLELDVQTAENDIDTLNGRTLNMSVNGFNETEFSTGILVNGEITNPSLVRFVNDSVVDGSETDLVISVAGIGKITTDNTIQTTQVNCGSLYVSTTISAPQIGTLESKTSTLESKTSSLESKTSTLESKTEYLTTTTGQSQFEGALKATGPITIVNGGSSYSFPLVGPSFLGSTLCPVNTAGTLAWVRPSFVRAYRSDATSQPAAHTFTSAFNSPLNLLDFMPTQAILGDFVWPGDGTVKYVGTVQRTFQASCTVSLSGDNKNLDQFSTMTMWNLTDNKVLATKSFNIVNNQVRDHCLYGVGSINTNNLIIVSLTVVANATVRSGSPNFSIILN